MCVELERVLETKVDAGDDVEMAQVWRWKVVEHSPQKLWRISHKEATNHLLSATALWLP